jgi:hypothetical protein
MADMAEKGFRSRGTAVLPGRWTTRHRQAEAAKNLKLPKERRGYETHANRALCRIPAQSRKVLQCNRVPPW